MKECSDFLQRVMGLDLTAADIAALERRTEGWIAGLQLAALSMQGLDDSGDYTLSDFVAAFTGSSHYILDYLIEEVFERQPAEVQDFLLRTCILDRFCGALCDAVSGRSDSRLLLERLEHANLFIVPLDQSRTWFRYHHLFSELLRQRLHASVALPENDLHARASAWNAAQGFAPEAIQHALAGSSWERAADLIRDSSTMMLRRGELITLLGWLGSLPDEVIYNRPQLCRDFGWAFSLTGQLDAAEAYLRRAEAAVHGDDALLGTILVAQAYNIRARGDNLQAIELAQRALALLPQSDPLSRGLVALTLGLAHWNQGNCREAEQAFEQVEQAAQLSRNHYARMTALTYLGVIQGVYGRLHAAAQLCQQVIQLGGQSPPVAPAYIQLGALLCEWNDLESAAHHLRIGIELCQRTGNLLILCDGYRTLAMVQLASGEPDAAVSTLQKARQLAGGHQITPLARVRLSACQVQLALAQEDLAAARQWAEQVTEPADACPFFPRLNLTPARLLLAQNDKAASMEMLAELYEIAHQSGWVSGTIEIRALQALAAETSTGALHYLEDALTWAQAEGFMRTFIDKGEPMKALLDKLRLQGGELKAYIRTLLAGFGEIGGAPIKQPLIEPLSERELEVLRLVAEGKSNADIAQQLVVSVGTVKSHIHNILEKIGAHSRTEAVARARELNLL